MLTVNDERAAAANCNRMVSSSPHGGRSRRHRKRTAKHARVAAGKIRELINDGQISRDTPPDQVVGMVGFGWLASMLWKPLLMFVVETVLSYYWERVE